MEIDHQLETTHAEEVMAVTDYLARYAELYPSIPIEQDDPDVRRLIEAMALLTARSRLAGQHHIAAAHHRLFQQLSPYLLTPLPAMGLIRLNPTALIEPALIEKGTKVVISAADTGEQAIFRTLFDLAVLPLRLARIETPHPSQLVIHLDSPRELRAHVSTLSLYINVLNNYAASLQIHQLLGQHLKEAQVSFGDANAAPLTWSTHLGPDKTIHDGLHPIEQERLFFHFPQQELYLHLTFPEPTQGWRRCQIILELDCPWPTKLRRRPDLLQHLFELFVVPVENLRSETAEPITCDGTQTRYAIQPQKLSTDLALHSVQGVYQVNNKAQTPLRPGLFKGKSGSYELQLGLGHGLESDQSESYAGIAINLPEAFHRPVTVSVEALWHQPDFSAVLWKQLRVQPYDINIPGIDWHIKDRFIPYTTPQFDQESELFLQLSALKQKDILTLDDVLWLLEALSSVWQREFAPLKPLLDSLQVYKGEQIERGVVVAPKLIYEVAWHPADEQYQPVIEMLMTRLNRILNAWIASVEIDVRHVHSEAHSYRPPKEFARVS